MKKFIPIFPLEIHRRERAYRIIQMRPLILQLISYTKFRINWYLLVPMKNEIVSARTALVRRAFRTVLRVARRKQTQPRSTRRKMQHVSAAFIPPRKLPRVAHTPHNCKHSQSARKKLDRFRQSDGKSNPNRTPRRRTSKRLEINSLKLFRQDFPAAKRRT